MKKAIVIPVYIRLHRPEELAHSEGLILAKRAVESLNILKDQDFILVLPVYIDLNREDEVDFLPDMDRFLRQEFRRLREGRTFLFLPHHLKILRRYLDQRGFRKLSSLTDLKGYSKIRNTGLLLAQMISMDAVIFIDNDEVIEDPDFLRIACEYLGETWSGKAVDGKGGFYLNPDGTISLPPQRVWWRYLWNKTKSMNRVWGKILSSKERLVPSSMLLGGNLVLHRNLFRSVPFDPCIPRGEDTDYLINASELGFCILFDKELRIKHLHPERTNIYFHEELRGDIERFLYEREKLKAGLKIDLDPYPGYFLKGSLYPKAILTSMLLSLNYFAKGEWKRAKDCFSHLNLFFQKREGTWLKYLKFKADWERAMKTIQEEGANEISKDCWV